MAESPELPEPAPWKKNLRLLRRREVKKREAEAKSRNLEVNLFEDSNITGIPQQRVQTPVQRYGHDSFEKGSTKPTTPHFDAGRYSTPPRTRSPKRSKLTDDSQLLQDLSNSLIKRRSRDDGTGNIDSPSTIYNQEVESDSEVEIGSGSSEPGNEGARMKDDNHPFKVAVSPLPMKASVDIVRENGDANNSLVDDTKGIMDERVVWADATGNNGRVKRSKPSNIDAETALHRSTPDDVNLPKIRRMKMSADGPTPGSKINFPKIHGVSRSPDENLANHQSEIERDRMKRMLGSLQRRKKQATRDDASLFTPSTSNHKDASPIPSSHARRKLKVELDSNELTKDKPQRRRRTRIRDAMHEFVESDVSSTHGSDNAFDNRGFEGENAPSEENIDEQSGTEGKETDDLDDSKPMWRSDMKDSDASDDESDLPDSKKDLATKMDDSGEGKRADAPASVTDETKGEDHEYELAQQEFNASQFAANRMAMSEGKSSDRGRSNLIDRGREWKVARSEAGKLYFYHRKTRKTQWNMPEDGIIVNIKEFPELQQSVPAAGPRENIRHQEDGIRENPVEGSGQNGGASTSNVMTQSYKTPSGRNSDETQLVSDPSRRLHFHSSSGDATEASVGDAHSTNNVTDHSFGSSRANNNSTMLFDDPRSKISPSAVMTGRMFAVKQAAMVLLSASPSTVAKFHCPYCSDCVERKYFVAHLQACDRLNSYINSSPSRHKNSASKSNGTDHQQSALADAVEKRYESKSDSGPVPIRWAPDHIVTPSKTNTRPSTTPGYRTPIQEINRSSDNESEESKSNSSPGDVTLYPCGHCGRTFAQSRLEVHERVCKRIFGEKRHQYDAAAKRTRGTPYRKTRGLPASSYSVPQPPRIRRTRADRDDETIGSGIDTKDSMYLSPSDRAGARNYKNGTIERPATTGSATKTAQCPFCKCSTRKQDLSSHLLKCKHQKKSRNTVWGAAKERHDGRINWSQRKNSSARRTRHKLSETPSVKSVDMM